MPVIGVGVVRNLVIVDVFARHEAAGDLDEFTGTDFAGTTRLFTVFGWDPASSDDKSCSINANRILLQTNELSERELTALVAIEGVDDVEAGHSLSLDNLCAWDQHFLGVVKLSNDEVRSEPMVNSPFLFGHAPPTEIHLFPRGAIRDGLLEFVVRFSSLPCLLDILSVVEVGETAR